jgi:hypothetical protein
LAVADRRGAGAEDSAAVAIVGLAEPALVDDTIASTSSPLLQRHAMPAPRTAASSALE